MAEKVTAGNMFGLLDQESKKSKAKAKKPVQKKSNVVLSTPRLFSGGSTNWADDDDDDDSFDISLLASNGQTVHSLPQDEPSQEPVSDDDSDSASGSEDEAEAPANDQGSERDEKNISRSKKPAPIETKKEVQKQLSKKELKKKELEELDAILNDLNVSKDKPESSSTQLGETVKEGEGQQNETMTEHVATDTAAAKILEQAGLSLESTNTTKKKKKKNKKKGKPNESTTESKVTNVAAQPEGGSSEVDIKKLLQAKLKKKKKPSSGASAVLKASVEEAKKRNINKKKKKDKTKFNQMPQR